MAADHDEGRSETREAAIARVNRAVRRLEALADARRLRVRVLRGLRGSLGAGATLATLVKLKIAGSLALKIGLAVAVGLGFAWPAFGLTVLLIGAVVVALAACEVNDCPVDCSGDGCKQREKRRERLDTLIAERRDWLANPHGRPPRLRPRTQ